MVQIYIYISLYEFEDLWKCNWADMTQSRMDGIFRVIFHRIFKNLLTVEKIFNSWRGIFWQIRTVWNQVQSFWKYSTEYSMFSRLNHFGWIAFLMFLKLTRNNATAIWNIHCGAEGVNEAFEQILGIFRQNFQIFQIVSSQLNYVSKDPPFCTMVYTDRLEQYGIIFSTFKKVLQNGPCFPEHMGV